MLRKIQKPQRYHSPCAVIHGVGKKHGRNRCGCIAISNPGWFKDEGIKLQEVSYPKRNNKYLGDDTSLG